MDNQIFVFWLIFQSPSHPWDYYASWNWKNEELLASGNLAQSFEIDSFDVLTFAFLLRENRQQQVLIQVYLVKTKMQHSVTRIED